MSVTPLLATNATERSGEYTPYTSLTEYHMRTQLTATAALLITITALVAALTGCEDTSNNRPVDNSPEAVAERVLERQTPARVCELAGGLYSTTKGTCSTGEETRERALCAQLGLLGYAEFRYNTTKGICERRG